MTKALKQSIGAQLRLAREKLGLSCQQLADRAGLDRRYIYQYEKGQHAPQADVLARLCTTLGATLTLNGYRISFYLPPEKEQSEQRAFEQIVLDFTQRQTHRQEILVTTKKGNQVAIQATLEEIA